MAVPFEEARVLRLNLKAGEVYRFNLRVVREDSGQTADLKETMAVKAVRNGVITLDATVAGLVLNGRDREEDLRRLFRKRTATFSWTPQARRTGGMTPLSIQGSHPELMPFLAEAGLYLCEFADRAVKAGDAWRGSVTATGGCTSGKYLLKAFRGDVAIVEVTEIAMMGSTQIGPMRMEVNARTGVPLRVDYRTKANATGEKSHFLLTLST